MNFVYVVITNHLESVLYVLTLFVGAAPDALALLRKRSFGRKSGLSRSPRRRRSGGIFGAFGALLLIFLFGGIAILVLGALALFRLIGRRRR